MSKKITTKVRANNRKAYCHFCGSTVGQRSDRTEEIIEAIYDCSKCRVNYCSECTYNDGDKQRCLRCESVVDKVM